MQLSMHPIIITTPINYPFLHITEHVVCANLSTAWLTPGPFPGSQEGRGCTSSNSHNIKKGGVGKWHTLYFNATGRYYMECLAPKMTEGYMRLGKVYTVQVQLVNGQQLITCLTIGLYFGGHRSQLTLTLQLQSLTKPYRRYSKWTCGVAHLLVVRASI